MTTMEHFAHEYHEESTSMALDSIDSGTILSASSRNKKETEELRRKLDSVVTRWKLAVAAALIVSAATLAACTYKVVLGEEEASFCSKFHYHSDKVVHIAKENIQDMQNVIEDVSLTMTSFALSQNSDWPEVSIPHFEQRGMAARQLAHIKFLAVSPIVSHEIGWQEFAARNSDWIQDGLRLQGTQDQIIQETVFPNYLHDKNGAPSASHGHFSPVWQMSPLPMNLSIGNLDLLSIDAFKETVEVANTYKRGFISSMFLQPSKLLGTSELPGVTETLPHAMFVQPIFRGFAVDDVAVGHIIAIVSFEDMIRNILHEGLETLLCVIKTSCGEAITYFIDGPDVAYAGMGDLHDTGFDDLGMHIASLYDDQVIGESASHLSQAPSFCEYSLHLYPSSNLYESVRSSNPIWYSVTVLLIFIVTSLFLLVHNSLVLKRQDILINTAYHTNQIVNSMFPENVREQLMKEAEATASKRPVLQSTGSTSRLRHFLDVRQEENDDVIAFDTKPIADLFPMTSVVFFSIEGFTEWSSQHEPAQIFELLEALFNSFDELARQRRIFKVETVGDCYVAVSGLPDPCKEHALVMARFARDCMYKMKEVVEQLERTLGPETGGLKMRCGLHSGPVVAGVLRGDASRFQLFGDTMNTASRIETTGQHSRVHVSQETAELLIEHGKAHWVEERADKVYAKGKGALKTYWLVLDGHNRRASVPPRTLDSSLHNNVPVSKDFGSTRIAPEAEQISRLIDWNCTILLRSIKQIVALRAVSGKETTSEEKENLQNLENTLGTAGSSVIDEIVEVIRMPNFNAEAPMCDPDEIDLGEEVEGQLRDFVTVISELYRDNPFHNFEHASHVMLSVSKLLSRIVAPPAVLEAGGVTLHDFTFGITSDPLTQFSGLLAALLHDVDHRGVPNFVLAKEDPELFAVYKGKSVAEQNSVDIAWSVLMDSSFDQLRACLYSNEEELRRLRQLIVNSVMATDIFDRQLGMLRLIRWISAFQGGIAPGKDSDRKATIVIEHLIQASDVSHTMQHWHVYLNWNEKLFHEMYDAFREGRMAKDPSANWYQGELGFFDNYIIPLAKKLAECGVFGVSSDEYLDYAQHNRKKWEQKGEAIVAGFKLKYCRGPAKEGPLNRSTSAAA